MMTEQEMQLQIAKEQGKANILRQEIAAMNKEREYWQHYRIQASIAAMQIVADKNRSVRDQHEQHLIAIYSVELADTLIAELQKKQD